MTQKLKPCPFCGGAQTEHPYPEFKENYQMLQHEIDCWFIVSGLKDDYHAISKHEYAAWNRRADGGGEQ